MKIFAKKMLFFIIIILILQLIITLFFPIEVDTFFKTLPILEEYLEKQAQIIYFGDSAIANVSEEDENKKHITQMFQDLLPNHLVGLVVHGAYDMDMYLSFCEYIINTKKYYPKIVIIPINLRSFSPLWDKNPTYQFPEEKIILKYNNNFLFRMFYKVLIAFKYFDTEPISDLEYKNTMVFNGDIPIGKVKDFINMTYTIHSEEKLKNRIIAYYMYSLKKEHKKIQSMLKIAKLLKSNDTDVIFYITPIDYQIGEKYCGDEFAQRINENVNLIDSLFLEEDIKLLDFSRKLDSDLFDWEKDYYINEHLKENGRKFVAENLYQEINSL